MLDYLLTEEQTMIRDLARKVALEKALPKRAEWDETGEFPWEAMKAFSDADLCGLYISEDLGGMGQSVFNFCLATEQISRICGGRESEGREGGHRSGDRDTAVTWVARCPTRYSRRPAARESRAPPPPWRGRPAPPTGSPRG